MHVPERRKISGIRLISTQGDKKICIKYYGSKKKM